MVTHTGMVGSSAVVAGMYTGRQDVIEERQDVIETTLPAAHVLGQNQQPSNLESPDMESRSSNISPGNDHEGGILEAPHVSSWKQNQSLFPLQPPGKSSSNSDDQSFYSESHGTGNVLTTTDPPKANVTVSYCMYCVITARLMAMHILTKVML